MRVPLALAAAAIFVAMTASGAPKHRYLALGDSYTIGESVAPAERWPVQLVRTLRAEPIDVADPVIIARTGWTTGELAAAIAEAKPPHDFDLVTLLIGVNDQYRGLDLAGYRVRFVALLRDAVRFARSDSRRVLVISIPDWGTTPFAEGRNRAQIAREIDAFNAAARDEARKLGVRFIDVTDISRASPQLVAEDGLHPSAQMYALWTKRIAPLAREAIR